MKEMLWIIINPKYQIHTKFKISSIAKWIITYLMKRKYITIQPIKEIKGERYNTIYIDEFT